MTVVAASGRVWHRNWLVYKRLWHRSLAFGFLQPLLFLTAMGLGLGAIMQPSDQTAFGNVPYLHWLGPGLMAATAMQTATFESTYPIMNKIMWGRNYEAMLSTPLSVRSLVGGEIAWSAFRIATLATVFLVVLTLFGIVRTPLAVLAVPVTTLVGVAFAACLIAFTATQKNDVGFSAVFRFIINPLFLFSGTFFPVGVYPDPVQWIMQALPLYHAINLIRGLSLGLVGPAQVWDLAYLVAFFVICMWIAMRQMERKLIK